MCWCGGCGRFHLLCRQGRLSCRGLESGISRARRSMLLQGLCPLYWFFQESLTRQQAWVYAHLRLTSEEAAEFKNCPVVYNGDVGFFFEPDEDGVIKVCDEFPGFTRFKKHQPYGADFSKSVSVPRSHAKHPTDTYPDASEKSIRRAIGTYLPRFNDNELYNRTLCWCADTADAAPLICE
jgi:hypothetical protein